MPMTEQTVAETVEQCLNGTSGFVLADAGFAVTALEDLGEIFLRTPGGEFFKLTVETVSPEDIDGWGIEFE